MLIISCLALAFSSMALGALIVVAVLLVRAERHLAEKTIDFDEIVKKAAETHNSMAKKVISLESEISTLSSKVNALVLTKQATGVKRHG